MYSSVKYANTSNANSYRDYQRTGYASNVPDNAYGLNNPNKSIREAPNIKFETQYESHKFQQRQQSNSYTFNNQQHSSVQRSYTPQRMSTNKENEFTSDTFRPTASASNNYEKKKVGKQESPKGSLGLMAAPKPQSPLGVHNDGVYRTNKTVSKNEEKTFSKRILGNSDREKICILTGTVERVIKYAKLFQNQFRIFQVIGNVMSMTDGKIPFEKIILLRDKKGPILQLTYYSNSTYINLNDFDFGQPLRAVGRMTSPNVMTAITIRAATSGELETLPRMCYISDNAVSTTCGTVRLH